VDSKALKPKHVRNFMNWDNPGTVLITGASSGIGASFARLLLLQGFRCVLVARRRDRLEALADELSEMSAVRAEVLTADLSTPSGVKLVEDRILELKDLDILVNNAGFGSVGCFADIGLQRTLDMIQVHITSPVHFVKAALPEMISRGRGVIINVSSLAVWVLRSGSVTYSASKSFLKVFSEALQVELRGSGVQVHALCPGFTRTEFHDVGDYRGWDKSAIPGILWMTSDRVVELCLKAVKKNKVIIVPGYKNKLFRCVLQNRIARKIAMREFDSRVRAHP